MAFGMKLTGSSLGPRAVLEAVEETKISVSLPRTEPQFFGLLGHSPVPVLSGISKIGKESRKKYSLQILYVK
jgi:hypothetical protein